VKIIMRELRSAESGLDPKKGSYEPEQFPALVYKDWGVSFLLFSSGKVIVAGAKTVEMAEEGIKNFEGLITSISS